MSDRCNIELAVARIRLWPAVAFAVICYCPVIRAEPIAAFRNTGVESFLELRYLAEDRTDSNAGVETLSQNRMTTEEEFSVLTRNYVYHPSFLKLDLGTGFTFVQDEYDDGSDSTKTSEGLYSLYGRASFLEKKPYPVSFFYSRENPASFSGLAERIQQTNTLYGFDFSLLEPVIPMRLNVFASSSDREGDSPNQVIDETTDRFGMRLNKNYTENYSQQLSYDHTEESSRSGSLNLPIMQTNRTTDVTTYSSDWRFGDRKQLKYYDRASLTQQEGLVNRDEITFSPNLQWQHSDKLRSYYRYHYLNSEISTLNNVIESTSHAANANVNYHYTEQTEFDAGAQYEDSQTTGLDNRLAGINGKVTHTVPLSFGKLTLSGGLAYRQNDRDSSAALARVIGESVTLSGLDPVALANDFIVTSSIVVENASRTQTYVEGVDYRLIVIGARTEIQRLSGSNIGDPETVVVDYDYQTGGSVVYTGIEQNYYAGLSINRYYNVYMRYRQLDQDITSGTPTLPLNSQQDLGIGARVEYPINRWLEVGADADLVNHDEDISPYDSQRYSVFSQFLLPYASNLRLTASQLTVDNHNSPEDIDLTSFSILLRTRPTDGLTVTAEAYTEEDTGGTETRNRDYYKLSARWRIYRLIVDTQLVFRNDRTGPNETERNYFLATVRREF